MDDVLVAVGGVERVILFRAEAEEDIPLEHVDPQRVHRRDHRVNPDVELEHEATKMLEFKPKLETFRQMHLKPDITYPFVHEEIYFICGFTS